MAEQHDQEQTRVLEAFHEWKDAKEAGDKPIPFRDLAKKYDIPLSSLHKTFKKLESGELPEDILKEGENVSLGYSESQKVVSKQVATQSNKETALALRIGIRVLHKWRGLFEVSLQSLDGPDEFIDVALTFFDKKPMIEEELIENRFLLERAKTLMEEAQKVAEPGFRSKVLIEATLKFYTQILELRALGIEDFDENLMKESFRLSLRDMLKQLDKSLLLEVKP